MSYFGSETLSWVDPYMLRAEHHFDVDDEEQRQIKSKLQGMADRREKESVILWSSAKAPKPESLFHPIDCDNTYITACAAANSTFACVTKNLQIHFFDQEGRVAPASLRLQGSTPSGNNRALPHLASTAPTVLIDAKDAVTKVLIDPLGCYVFVTFSSGACLMFHIRKGDKAPKPQRHDVIVPASVTGLASFPVESIAWDPNNEFETSTGEILLGSGRGGCIVSCRCEPSGVAGLRKVFTFPPPFSRAPVHSLAMTIDSEDARRRTVLVAVEHRLFYFSGRGSIESMFDGFSSPETLTNYISVAPSPTASPIAVRILQYSKKHPEFPAAFSWQCGDTMVVGQLKANADVVPAVDPAQDGTGMDARPSGKKKKKSEGGNTQPLRVSNMFEVSEVVRKLMQYHALECVAYSAVRPSAAAAPALPPGEKIVHVSQSMFHLAIMTTKRLYCFASSPLLPFDFTRASGCALNNRLVVNCAVPMNEGAKGKMNDAAHMIICDRRLGEKFFIVSARDLLELGLPPQKGQFAVLFSDCARALKQPGSGQAENNNPADVVTPQKKAASGKSVASVASVDQQVRVALGTANTVLSVTELFTCAHILAKKVPSRVQQSIHLAEAEVRMKLRQHSEAALSYAVCPRRGIDASIMELSQLPSTDAMISFLNEKLRYLADHRSGIEHGITEATCLASWLVALLLDKCTQLGQGAALAGRGRRRTRREGNDETNQGSAAAPGSFTLDAAKKLLGEVIGREKDFLPWEPMRQLLFSIGSPDQVLYLCNELGKHKELTEFLIIHERFYDALTVLTEKCADASYYRVWQRYSLLLIQHYPVRLIKKGWIDHGADLELDPLTLIPALSHYDRTRNETRSDAEGPVNRLPTSGSQMLASDYEQVSEHVGITFLKHAIGTDGSCEPALHNLLLAELAKNGTDEELVRFIDDSEYLDKQYAMRVCLAQNRMLGCIHLYFRLGHVQQAVSLALREQREALAKQLIKKIDAAHEVPLLAGEDLTRLRQTLWTMVIKHVAPRQDGGPRNALLVAGESSGDVNVSHVLPELSDDVMICEFKAELLTNVQQFGMLMKGVQEDIKMANKDAETLRSDLALERAKEVKCNAAKKCDACSQIITNRSAMIFFRGCGHCFHSSCFSNRLQFFAALARGPSSGRCDELECYLCSASTIRAIITAPTNVRLGLDSVSNITI